MRTAAGVLTPAQVLARVDAELNLGTRLVERSPESASRLNARSGTRMFCAVSDSGVVESIVVGNRRGHRWVALREG